MRLDQLDYPELNLSDKDVAYEATFFSGLSFGTSGYNTKTAKYLTRKGASVDSDIQWCSHIQDKIDGARQKRPRDSPDDADEPRKLFRFATVASFSAAAKNDMRHKIDQCDLSASDNDPYKLLGVSCLSKMKLPRRYFDNGSSECSSIGVAMSSIETPLHSCKSISSSGSFSRNTSVRLSVHTIPKATVLLLDIKGFTAQCAAMSAGRVGEWVASFYERVDAVAAEHGVSKVEVRGDCCVCVAGVEGAVPSRAIAASAAEDRQCDQATRMLAFASALHAALASLPAAEGGVTTARMGVATGAVSFLVSDADAAPFASVYGDAVTMAARMEGLAVPGALYVHRSSADRWAAESRLPPPASEWMECEGGGGQRAAVYDCAAGSFRGTTAASKGTRRRGSWSV